MQPSRRFPFDLPQRRRLSPPAAKNDLDSDETMSEADMIEDMTKSFFFLFSFLVCNGVMHDFILIARFFLCFCSELLNHEVVAFMEELNVTHNLDDIDMSMPYVEVVEEVEMAKEAQVNKKRSRSSNYKTDEGGEDSPLMGTPCLSCVVAAAVVLPTVTTLVLLCMRSI